MANRYEAIAPMGLREVPVLADELEDDVAITVAVNDRSIYITQGPDLVVVPGHLWERFAAEVMGAVMELWREG